MKTVKAVYLLISTSNEDFICRSYDFGELCRIMFCFPKSGVRIDSALYMNEEAERRIMAEVRRREDETVICECETVEAAYEIAALDKYWHVYDYEEERQC